MSRRVFRWLRPASPLSWGNRTDRLISSLLALVLLHAVFALPADADEAPPPSGSIVSIRGNILEVQPAWLTGHRRLMIDNKTQIVQEQVVPFRKVPLGTRVALFGNNDPKSGLTGFYIIAGALQSQGFGGKLSGIMQSQWGSYWGGKLKSIDPFVVADDDGKDLVT